MTAIVGPPDQEELLAPKRDRDWKCRGLVYYSVIYDQSPGNIKDKRIEFVFDRADRLIAILSTVVGISNQGDMSACR